ncbi:Response regulator NasT [plant metagenome]|uniref:Response regulator NasT n=1 Tax=plant metagenome TaxID=1297885 RepID=A0A484TGQ6_9ZZZZ
MNEHTLPDALRYLIAARRAETTGLEALAHVCTLVTQAGELVHALQKERGYSNVYLAAEHASARETLLAYAADADVQARALRQGLERLDPAAQATADKARLLTRVAYVLYRLDELPALRRRVLARDLDIETSLAHYTRLINGLLGLVFDAADTALDPEVTRALVALFNLMQGKELAGQERACGVRGFAAGQFTAPQHAQLAQLIDGQDRCFEAFLAHAQPPQQAAWAALAACEAELRQLRGMAARTSPDARVDAALAQIWFDVQTARIDGMRAVEAELSAALPALCQARIARAHDDLDNHRRLARRLAEPAAASAVLFTVQGNALDAGAPDLAGPMLSPQLSRSLLDLVQAQAQRLQALSDALAGARSSLDARKHIEQAKQLLMAHHTLSEAAAHDKLRKAAMSRGLKLEEFARQVLAAGAGGQA